jgi:hypothetical protein
VDRLKNRSAHEKTKIVSDLGFLFVQKAHPGGFEPPTLGSEDSAKRSCKQPKTQVLVVQKSQNNDSHFIA